MAYLEWVLAVGFGLGELVNYVEPAAAAYSGRFPGNADDVRLALYEANGEAVDGEYVQRLEGHRVVAAEHVLVADQIRKVGRQRVGDSGVFLLTDAAAYEFEPEELPSIEHLSVKAVPPAVESVGFVARGDFFLRKEPVLAGGEAGGSFIVVAQVGGRWLLEEAPLMFRAAALAMVLDGKHPMGRRPV